jgi:hypothetical protein
MIPAPRKPWLLAVMLLALVWALASCGGSASSLNPGGAPTGDSRILPLGSALPTLPDGVRSRETPNRGTSRRVSALQPYNGADFIAASGATVEGTSVLLQSSADDIAWALYKAEGLAGKDVTRFAIETQPGGLEQQYSVGISNFTDNRWEYYITTSLPEMDVDLSEDTRKLISILGNLYYVVVVSGGDSVRVDTAWLDIVEGGEYAPGVPQGLAASYDQPDSISLWWLESAGATSYEIYRRAAAFPGGGGEEEYVQVGTSDAPFFQDFMVEKGVGYEYRVTASNAYGTSDYSEPVFGIAGDGGEDPREEYEFAFGPIEALDDSSITVEGKTFAHDEFTYWFNAWGLPVDSSEFAVGDTVYVDGVVEEDGSLTAFYVSSADDWSDDYYEWANGEVEAVDAGSIKVGGLTFTFNEYTWFTDMWGNQVDVSFFEVGDIVYVEGIYDEAGVLVATYVMESFDNDMLYFEGEVAGIDATTLALADGTSFVHDANTKFYDANGMETTWEGILLGDYIYANALEEGGNLVLTYVNVFRDGEEHLYYTGYITALGEANLSLDNEHHYTFGAETHWYLADGTEVGPDAFAIDDYVTVEALSDDGDPFGGHALYVYMAEGDPRF